METTNRPTANLTAAQLLSMSSSSLGTVERIARSVCPDFPRGIDGKTEHLERVALDLEVLQRQAALAWQTVTAELERRKS